MVDLVQRQGPISYTGRAALAGDIANPKAGLGAADIPTGFITVRSPGSASRIGNEYYASEEKFVYAWADVLREEYRAIIDAGLIVQIDDPSIAENWDRINPEPGDEDYQRFTRIRVEALNHALRGLPEEQIRFHVCWGSAGASIRSSPLTIGTLLLHQGGIGRHDG